MKAIGFLGGQFGDLVIMTVCCRAFKRAYPDGHLTFAVAAKYRDILPLFFNHPLIDDFHVWEGYDTAWPTAADKEYTQWRGYDMVCNAIAQHTRPDWYNHHHYAEEACLRFGLSPPVDLSYELAPWTKPFEDCQRVVTLSLFPSGGQQMHKTMPVTECEKLCAELKSKGYTPIQLGGRLEVKLENAIAPDLSILEAATLMRSSRLHITADTAFSSVAAAYKHPTLGFYGLGYPNMTTCTSHLPPNVNATYIKDRDPKTVTSEDLLSLIETKGLLS